MQSLSHLVQIAVDQKHSHSRRKSSCVDHSFSQQPSSRFWPRAPAARADDIKIALIYGKTGPLEAYAKQTETGLRMGFEYATKGTMAIDGRKIVLITKDDQGKPDCRQDGAAPRPIEDDKVDLAIGTTASAAALAMLPVAEENKKVLIVEPAVADSDHRRQVEPLHLPHRPQLLAGRDLERGRDRQAGRHHRDARRRTTPSAATASRRSRRRWPKTGATHRGARNMRPPTTTDFTASAQRLFDALKDKPGRKIIWVIWAGPTIR